MTRYALLLIALILAGCANSRVGTSGKAPEPAPADGDEYVDVANTD